MSSHNYVKELIEYINSLNLSNDDKKVILRKCGLVNTEAFRNGFILGYNTIKDLAFSEHLGISTESIEHYIKKYPIPILKNKEIEFTIDDPNYTTDNEDNIWYINPKYPVNYQYRERNQNRGRSSYRGRNNTHRRQYNYKEDQEELQVTNILYSVPIPKLIPKVDD